jgi:hypothetical protein
VGKHFVCPRIRGDWKNNILARQPLRELRGNDHGQAHGKTRIAFDFIFDPKTPKLFATSGLAAY